MVGGGVSVGQVKDLPKAWYGCCHLGLMILNKAEQWFDSASYFRAEPMSQKIYNIDIPFFPL